MSARPPFRRDKRNAMLLGVCAGFANYTGLGTAWVRIGLVLTTIFLLPPLFIAYFVIGWLAPGEDGRRVHHGGYGRRALRGPGRSISEMRARFGEVDRRLADTELLLTSRHSRLSREIDSLR